MCTHQEKMNRLQKLYILCIGTLWNRCHIRALHSLQSPQTLVLGKLDYKATVRRCCPPFNEDATLAKVWTDRSLNCFLHNSGCNHMAAYRTCGAAMQHTRSTVDNADISGSSSQAAHDWMSDRSQIIGDNKEKHTNYNEKQHAKLEARSH